MKFLRNEFTALATIIIGVILAVYVGVYEMLICGIIKIVNAIASDPVNASGIAWGIVMILFASPVAWIIVIGSVFIAGLILPEKFSTKKRRIF